MLLQLSQILQWLPKYKSCVSIPQAVGVVTTVLDQKSTVEFDIKVSIPQAVGVVTTHYELHIVKSGGFNTAGGRCCYN